MEQLAITPTATMTNMSDMPVHPVRARRIGEVLVKMNYVTQAQVLIALEQQRLAKQNGKSIMLGELLVRNAFCSHEQVVEAVRIAGMSASMSVDIPGAVKKRLKVALIGIEDEMLLVSPLQPPLLASARDELLRHARRSYPGLTGVKTVILDRAAIRRDLLQSSSVTKASLQHDIDRLNDDVHDSRLIQDFMLNLFTHAMQERASDIHIVRSENDLDNWVSYRVDGSLKAQWLLTKEVMGAVATLLKNDAGLDSSEMKKPQDGRTEIDYQGRRVDVRVASLPSGSGGEKITARLLDMAQLKRIPTLFADLPEIGNMLEKLVANIGKRGALTLVTGPTGSGKTSTMYALLQELPRDLKNVMTAEDPIEYRLPGATQTQVNESVNLGYSRILKAQLRSDPDVMVVGEIRDPETAEIVLRSVVSGHTVFGTLHTSNCFEAISHLSTMVPEAYRAQALSAITKYLRAVINQILVPKLCDCSVPIKVKDDAALGKVAHECGLSGDDEVRQAVGCKRCNETGYYGRTMVPEFLYIQPHPSVSKAILNALSEHGGMEHIIREERIHYVSRNQSFGQLLKAGIVDLNTAATELEAANG